MKVVELVKCEKCNKEMTRKTLRYTHPKMCHEKVIDRNEIPVEERNKTKGRSKNK